MSEPKSAAAPLPQLVVIHGEKGGVGKSTVARLIGDYLAERGVEYVAYDGDPASHDFGRFRKEGTTTDVVLDDVVSIRPVLDRLMSRKDASPKIALVDLSAGAGNDLASWLVETRALHAASAGRLVITVVFVVGATRTSVDNLVQTHKFLQDKVAWVIALNEHLAEKFEAYDASEIRRTLQAQNAVEVRIPSLKTEIYQEIDRLQISFRAARDNDEDEGLKFSWAGNVGNFLEIAFWELDRCGALLGRSPGTRAGK